MTESSVQPEDIHRVKTAECLQRNGAAVQASCAAGNRAKEQSCPSLSDQIMSSQSLGVVMGRPHAPRGDKSVYPVILHSGNL